MPSFAFSCKTNTTLGTPSSIMTEQPSPLSEDDFWAIVEEAKQATSEREGRPGALKESLRRMSTEKVAAFQMTFDHFVAKAYRWDLWGAAYVARGGCSDDSFIDFRYFLISEGRAIFETVLSSPDSLADLEVDDSEDLFLEEYGYAAGAIYEEKAGEDMPGGGAAEPNEPIGVEWDEDSVDELYPSIAKRFWGA